jgi:2-hydroxychromene-2-carboxylate isomerase
VSRHSGLTKGNALDIKKHSRLEFWFEFGSNYSYLSVMRIEELARKSKIQIAWKPFLLGPIFRDLGWNSSPFVLQAEKGRYVWRDMEREALKYRLEFKKPSQFPRMAVLPMRVALLGAEEPWIGSFCRAVMRQNWVNDLDINDPANVRRALDGLVSDPDRLIQNAQSEANKTHLRDQTAEARRRGIFGAPTFFFGDEMFWGNDRLEDAFAWVEAALFDTHYGPHGVQK